jgi:CMP-N,N'-diacetyllegionaminic acid synthase|tara:strand:+ start:453 stop:800 length:348 start_codon:yes stop_codon:yes gene_type:complete
MIYCFDLDGTLCTLEVDGMVEGPSKDKFQYMKAKPIEERIALVNSLYDAGHTIIIETARGNVSGIDWHASTKNQLKNWGVKFHTLRTGVKHAADIYIDDKALNANEFFYALSMAP